MTRANGWIISYPQATIIDAEGDRTFVCTFVLTECAWILIAALVTL